MPGRAGSALAVVIALLLAPAALAAPRLEQVASFTEPTSLTGVPGRPGTVAVTERAGRIVLLTGSTKATLLDITAKVQPGYVEQGLLSVAFSPDYATTGRFYVFYTEQPSGNLRVEEYRRSAADQDAADPASARFVIGQQHSGAANHNGGQLQFNADGYLYIAMGDGGGAGDPEGDAQNLTNLLGKILRIDPRGTPPYAIPPDNPFAGTAGARPEIWAYGLRNPWRFSFDRATGAMAIGDVGQDRFEEVDWVDAASGAARGVNFGWNHWEGLTEYAGGGPLAGPGTYTPPVLTYAHPDGCSITGGYVVRDPALPTLVGRYLYADYCRDKLHSAALPDGGSDREEAPTVAGVGALGEDDCGHVYVVSLAGAVSRVADAAVDDACVPPNQVPPGGGTTPQPTPGATPDTVAPTLLVSGRRRQAILPRKRGLRVTVECNEACKVRGTVTVQLGGQRGKVRFTSRTRSLPAGRRGTLRWKPRKAFRHRIARALRVRHPHVRAIVRVGAKDAAGNAATSRRITVRITRR